MGFVKVVKANTDHPPCPLPFVGVNARTKVPDFDVGTVWQCDTCKRFWKLAEMPTPMPARGGKGKWVEVDKPND